MKPKKSYSQAARVQGILRTLWARDGITIGELSEEFGVNRRTIYRDLRALQDSGYPLLSEVVEGAALWILDPSFKHTPPITFSLNELIALYSSRNLFKAHGLPLNSDLESALKKITSALPAKNIAKLERMEGMFLPLAKGSRRPSIDKNLFEVIQLALLYQNPITLEYKPRRANQSFQSQVHPYSMVHHRGDLYLLCFVPKWNGMRYLAVEGIKKAERSKERFEIREDFSASDFLNVPFGIFHGEPVSVKILFDKELTDYIRGRTWHPTQKIKATGDGEILLSMAASGKEEIKAWILGFGRKAEVISPKSLRDEIQKDLLKSLTQYRGGVTG
jgi:predicted DNA-binding transcriptional regulator YafY